MKSIIEWEMPKFLAWFLLVFMLLFLVITAYIDSNQDSPKDPTPPEELHKLEMDEQSGDVTDESSNDTPNIEAGEPDSLVRDIQVLLSRLDELESSIRTRDKRIGIIKGL